MLQSLGVEIVALPFELHPEIPVEGVSTGERRYARVAMACEEVGLPFRPPERIPNTRRALQTAECVRQRHPDAFPALDRALFEAHFVEGRFLGDPDVLDEVVNAAGAPADEVRAAVENGELRAALRESMEAAMDAGVTGTPAWLLDGRFLLPGAQPRDTIRRIVERLQS